MAIRYRIGFAFWQRFWPLWHFCLCPFPKSALPAILLGVALVGGPLRLPFFPVIDRLGDASYALYLLHIPMGWLWIWGFQKVVVGQPELFAATLITATIIASIAFYVLIERPLLRVLNRILRARAPRPNQAP